MAPVEFSGRAARSMKEKFRADTMPPIVIMATLDKVNVTVTHVIYTIHDMTKEIGSYVVLKKSFRG